MEAHMDPNSGEFSLLVLAMVFGVGIIIPIGIVWLQNRTKMKALEILKAYAEKGEEPPASVLDAVHKVNWPPGVAAPPPFRRPTRGDHLSHVAGSVVLGSGAAAIAWWRLQLGDMGAFLIVSMIAAVFFAGAAAARLVAALTTRDDG
jgi:biotin transporter BioY